MSLYESLNDGPGPNMAFNALPALAWARANGMRVHALALVHLAWLPNAAVESTTTVRGESDAKRKAEAAGLIAPGVSTGDALTRIVRELASAGMPAHMADPWVNHYGLGANQSLGGTVSSVHARPDVSFAESHSREPAPDGGPSPSVPRMGTYKDVADDRFLALEAAINATNTPYGKRPVAQLLRHLRWSRPNQTVHWNAGTTPAVPETAAGLAIDVGTPLPDAMEIVFAALRNELSGEALASLDAYHHAVHDLNAQYGVAPSITPAMMAPRAPESLSARRGGTAYMTPTRTEAPETEASIFVRDPNVIDRGTAAHKDIQDLLADHIRGKGLTPASPDLDDPKFDVAWVNGGTLYVCEVKSLTETNEESQLRLGLGQLLSYLYRTNLDDWPGVSVIVGVLAVESPPNSVDWVEICARSGVILTWPHRFADLFQD